jgi:rhodanese-related sulfurtransferase
MAFTKEEIGRNRDYFAEKLSAERQLADVQHWVNRDAGAPDFVLLDTRARDAFAKAHIPGALSAPVAELAQLASKLPRDKELVTYCWSRT